VCLSCGGNCVDSTGEIVHTHFSALAAVNIFLAVLIVGTVWRVVALHLTASPNHRISAFGQAMAFQY